MPCAGWLWLSCSDWTARGTGGGAGHTRAVDRTRWCKAGDHIEWVQHKIFLSNMNLLKVQMLEIRTTDHSQLWHIHTSLLYVVKINTPTATVEFNKKRPPSPNVNTVLILLKTSWHDVWMLKRYKVQSEEAFCWPCSPDHLSCYLCCP